jgi:hypothetical protein
MIAGERMRFIAATSAGVIDPSGATADHNPFSGDQYK